MMTNVIIGDKDMYKDFGMILAKADRGNPEPKAIYIDVPLRDGSIDATNSLSDEVYYNDREMELQFLCLTEDKASKITEVSNYLNGSRKDIIFPDDPNFKYIGRISVSKWETDKHAGRLVLEIVADPYKYDINSSLIDWEWDVFDFEEGIINELNQLVVDGEREITLICRRKRMFPVFIASDNMTMKYEDQIYDVIKGEHKLYNVFFKPGYNKMTFYGKGTISIDYVGGDL